MVFGILENLRGKWREAVPGKETPEIIFLKYILSLLDRDPRHKALHDAIKSAGTVVGRTGLVIEAVGWVNFSAAFHNWRAREASNKDWSSAYKTVEAELIAAGYLSVSRSHT